MFALLVGILIHPRDSFQSVNLRKICSDSFTDLFSDSLAVNLHT